MNFIIVKDNYLLARINGKLTKTAFKKKRKLPVNVAGDSTRNGGNRKFELVDEKTLRVKFSKELSYDVELKTTSKRYAFILNELTKIKNIPITYAINENYVCITFDEEKLPVLKTFNSPKNPNICIGIDVNPGYIGISILKKTKVLYTEQLKTTNYENNQQNNLAHMAKRINQLINIYNVGVVAMEELNFFPGKNSYNKQLNKTLLGWNRRKFKAYVIKYCKINGVKFKEVNAAYSSIIGNFMYPSIPDACAAALEISRRGLEGDKFKNYPAFKIENILTGQRKYLEEMVLGGWRDLCEALKKQNIRWRNDLPSSYPEKTSEVYTKQYCSRYTVENILQ
jgi:IS605 OrfB family transposase